MLRVYTGNVTTNTTFKSVSFDQNTTIGTLLKNSLRKFRVPHANTRHYYLTIKQLEYGDSHRRLAPDENINSVLDSYGVMSFISEAEQRSGRKSSISRVSQAEGQIQISLFLEVHLPIRICFEDEMAADIQWENLEVSAQTRALDVIEKAGVLFGATRPFDFRLLDLNNNSYFNPEDLLMASAKEAQESGKSLSLKLEFRVNYVADKRSYDPEPLHDQENKRNKRISSAIQLKERKIKTLAGTIDFDSMLNSLHTAISGMNPDQLPLQKLLHSFERDLNKLIGDKGDDSEEIEVDAYALLQAIKDNRDTFDTLNTNLNDLLSAILIKNS